jgi:transcriptional regulator with AAA-type ATPase domain
VDVVGGSPSISGMFHTAGGAVLILGEPGAGKDNRPSRDR